MNTFEQIDETKIRVRIADVKPDSDDVKLCVDIIDMGAYKCSHFINKCTCRINNRPI